MKKCLNCNELTKNPKFCSLSCQITHRNNQLKLSRVEKYNTKPKFCNNCNIPLVYEKRRNKYCSHSCSATVTNLIPRLKSGPEKTIFPFRKVDFIKCDITGKIYCSIGPGGGRRQQSPYIKTEKEKYYELSRFKFNVFDFPDYFNLSLIEKHGWYTCPGQKRSNLPKNINGVSRDHIISISEGFKNDYNPKNLAHPANCKLMIHLDNKRKNDNSNMSYSVLLDRINNWKY